LVDIASGGNNVLAPVSINKSIENDNYIQDDPNLDLSAHVTSLLTVSNQIHDSPRKLGNAEPEGTGRRYPMRMLENKC
jgi:hypothetical protein